MKRFLGIVCAFFLLNGCDDGDLTVENINFEDVDTKSCTEKEILFKLKPKEALLLEIDSSAFVNEPTTPNEPKIIDIGKSKNRVVYRFYDGEVVSDNICSSIPPAKPNVNGEWIASEGKIQITTTPVTVDGKVEGSTKISGFNHNIVLKNISFDKGNGIQKYETFPFGDYFTLATTLPFSFDKSVEKCANSNQIFNFSSAETIVLENLDASLIVNEETPLDKPRTALLGTTKNKLTYRLHNGIPNASYFCNATLPTTPSIIETWIGVDGLANISGIIEVTTIKSGTTAFKHTIVIKNASLKKGNSSFKLGKTFSFGELILP